MINQFIPAYPGHKVSKQLDWNSPSTTEFTCVTTCVTKCTSSTTTKITPNLDVEEPRLTEVF